MRRQALLLVAVLALVLVPASTAARSSMIVGLVDLGSGAAEAWVFSPEGQHDCVLTFIHDDGDLSPARYDGWLSSMALRDHCVIVFPRYQVKAHATAAENLRGLRASLATGLTYVRKTTFAVAGAQAYAQTARVIAGFGTGGSLAFTLATQSRAWGLGPTAAVYSVFPVVSAGAPLPAARLDPGVHVLVQLGAHDRVAGPASAAAVRRYLGSRGHTTVQTLGAPLGGNHGSPLQVTSPAENAFWGPLDNLIGDVTPSTGG